MKEVDNVLSYVRMNGYLLAELSKIDWAGKNASVFISLGNQYKSIQLSRGDISISLWNKAGFSSNVLEIRNSSSLKVDEVFADLLKVYENNGY
ncbi:hypothetical protein EON63_25370, partial [archaeon]